MKKLTKTLICSVCAVSVLAGAAIPASACDLTAEELFEKYSDTYALEWSESSGYYLWLTDYNDFYACYDADGNVCDYFEATYIADNEYRTFKKIGGELDYNCEFEDGFYYAIKDDGTAVIAGCDYDYLAERTPTEMMIPEKIGGAVVTEIAQYAFERASNDMSDLIRVSIPDTVEVIGNAAFYEVFCPENAHNCSINMPTSVKSIGCTAFSGETAWAFGEEITLPESTEYVSTYAFGDKHPLIRMPESLVFTGYVIIGDEGRWHVCLSPSYDKAYKKTLSFYEETAANYYVDGKYNVVSLLDLREALRQKWSEQKPANGLLAGDLSANNEIDLADAVLLARAVGGSSELSAEARAAADLNGDSTVDAADLAILMEMLAGN